MPLPAGERDTRRERDRERRLVEGTKRLKRSTVCIKKEGRRPGKQRR
jgi:hypothetical protein